MHSFYIRQNPRPPTTYLPISSIAWSSVAAAGAGAAAATGGGPCPLISAVINGSGLQKNVSLIHDHQLRCEKIYDCPLTLFKVRNNGIYLSIAEDHIIYGRFNFEENGGGFGFGSGSGKKLW